MVVLFFYLCPILILFDNSNAYNAYLSIPYTTSPNGYEIELTIPSIYSSIKFSLDMSTEFTTINKAHLYNKTIQGDIVTSDIILSANNSIFSIPNCHIRTIDNNSKKSQGIIGLSPFVFQDREHSFLFQLYDKGVISNLSFSLDTYYNRDRHKVIYFGGLPLLPQSMNEITLKIDISDNKWSIDLQGFYFGTQSYNYTNTNFAFVNINKNWIYAPDGIITYLSDTIFKDYIKRKLCLHILQGESQYFTCKCSIVNIFPNMTFIINGHKLLFKPMYLFHKIQPGSNCRFLIQNNILGNEYHNTWYIGNVFFNQFVTEFDFESQSIHLYSNYIIKYERSNKKVIRSLLLLIVLLLILDILVNVIVSIKL